MDLGKEKKKKKTSPRLGTSPRPLTRPTVPLARGQRLRDVGYADVILIGRKERIRGLMRLLQVNGEVEKVARRHVLVVAQEAPQKVAPLVPDAHVRNIAPEVLTRARVQAQMDAERRLAVAVGLVRMLCQAQHERYNREYENRYARRVDEGGHRRGHAEDCADALRHFLQRWCRLWEGLGRPVAWSWVPCVPWVVGSWK